MIGNVNPPPGGPADGFDAPALAAEMAGGDGILPSPAATALPQGPCAVFMRTQADKRQADKPGHPGAGV